MGSSLVPVLSLTTCLASPDSRTLLASNTELCSRWARVPASLSLGRPLRCGVSSSCLGAGPVRSGTPREPPPARLCFPPEGLRLVIEVYSLSGVVGRSPVVRVCSLLLAVLVCCNGR